VNFLFVVLLALALDAIFGDPDRIWSKYKHPAVLMGDVIDWLDVKLNRGSYRRPAGFLAIGAASLLAIAIGILFVLLPDEGILGFINGLLQALVAATLLAFNGLVGHVTAVAVALEEDLEKGRVAVSQIVGRDTEDMTESDVSRAAIESAAENLSDAVIAPLLWFLIFGMPGLLLYKMVNTADSMIGHRTEQYSEFGYAAAKLDDLLNWVPARVTGFLICLAHLSQDAMNTMIYQADLHRSPNAGWPESAMAGVLEISLAGPRVYEGEQTNDPFLNPSGRRDLIVADIDEAVMVLNRTMLVVFVIFAVPALLILLF
jgi:adenosylcobinamide-phosphate synthase